MGDPTLDLLKTWGETHDGKLPSEHLEPYFKRVEAFGTKKKYFGSKAAPAGVILESNDKEGNDRLHLIAVNAPHSTLVVSPALKGIELTLKGEDGADYGTEAVNITRDSTPDPNRGSVFLHLSGHKKGTQVEIGGEFKKPTRLVLVANPSKEIGVAASYGVTFRADAKGGAGVNVLPGTGDLQKESNSIKIRMPVSSEDTIVAYQKEDGSIEDGGGRTMSGIGYYVGHGATAGKKSLNVAIAPSKSLFSGNQVRLVLYDPGVPGVERTITLQNGIPVGKDGKPIIKPDDISIEKKYGSGAPSTNQRDMIQACMDIELESFRQEVKKKQSLPCNSEGQSLPDVTESHLEATGSNKLKPAMIKSNVGLKF
jgi:hypothetical protein